MNTPHFARARVTLMVLLMTIGAAVVVADDSPRMARAGDSSASPWVFSFTQEGGVQALDLAALNASLGALTPTRPPFDAWQPSIGSTFLLVTPRRLVLATDAYIFGSMKRATGAGADRSVQTFGALTGTVRGGWAVVNTETVRLMPTAGLGFAVIGLSFIDHTEPTFAEVAAMNSAQTTNDPQTRSLVTGAWFADASLRLETGLTLASSPHGALQAILAVEVGYALSLPGSTWITSGIEATAGPEVGVGGFFARVGVGFSGLFAPRR